MTPLLARLHLSLRSLGLLALTLFLISSAASCARRSPTIPTESSPSTRPAQSDDSSEPDDAEGEVMVSLAPGVDPQQLGQEYGATLQESSGSGAATYLPGQGENPENLATRLRSDSRVLTSERNGYLETAESRQQSFAFDDGRGTPQVYSSQPATEEIGLRAAGRVSQGRGVLVAILDTGADLTHPAIASQIAGGWDFISGDADPTDEPDGLDNDGDGFIDEARGHGTHVAGIVARIAPEARLLIVRVLDADGRGDMLSVASGIRWAIDHGARVINLSLGMMRPSAAIEDLLEQADASSIVCVTSAGNWGGDSPVEYPASSAHALAVAALDSGSRAASFTSHGSFVALSAPGVAICSAYIGGRYALWSGTSMAAPFVSGTAALLLSVHPYWDRRSVVDRLGTTALPLDVLNPDIGGELGAGELNAAKALAPDLPIGLPPQPIHHGS